MELNADMRSSRMKRVLLGNMEKELVTVIRAIQRDGGGELGGAMLELEWIEKCMGMSKLTLHV